MHDERQFLHDYYRAFSTLDPRAAVPFFHDGCVFAGPQGFGPAPILSALTAIIEGLRARGYGRSELTALRVKRLSAATALASGIAARYKTDGQELERVGVTYLLQMTAEGWKIGVTVIHDAEAAAWAA